MTKGSGVIFNFPTSQIQWSHVTLCVNKHRRSNGKSSEPGAEILGSENQACTRLALNFRQFMSLSEASISWSVKEESYTKTSPRTPSSFNC